MTNSSSEKVNQTSLFNQTHCFPSSQFSSVGAVLTETAKKDFCFTKLVVDKVKPMKKIQTLL